MSQELIIQIENQLKNGGSNDELAKSLSSLLGLYKKSQSRLEKITKLSDKQQDRILKINENSKAEQELGHQKQKVMITNELEDDNGFDISIVYMAADILSGDSYSIHKTKDGGVLIYLVDAMGHGLLPSLTSFAMSSFIKQAVLQVSSLEEMLQRLSYLFESMLAEDEQLSFGFFWFDGAFSELTYSMGGIYPAFLKDKNGVTKLSSNNMPAMNFAANVRAQKIKLSDFEKIVIYSDGLVEGALLQMHNNNPLVMLEKSFVSDVSERAAVSTLDDDLTIIHFQKL